MQLDVNDMIVAKAGATDINRAFANKSLPPDWFITLDDDSAGSLDAMLQPDGRFKLVHADDTGRREAEADAATTKAVFQKFLAGDPSWRNACSWQDKGRTKSARKLTAPSAGGQPPRWALMTMTVIVGAIVLIFLIGQVNRGLLHALIPFSDSHYFWVGLLVLPMVALVAVAIASKLLEFGKAASWTRTTGRIVQSGTETRRHRFAGEPETIVNVPAVQYEFKVDGRTVRGSRIAIGEDSGGVNTEATLARYPKGAEVTVFYDPADSANCVLERNGPAGVTQKGCIDGLALLAFLATALYGLLTRGPAFVAAHFPKAADPDLPIFIACFGLALLVFFIGMFRYQRRAAHWPSVSGTIVASTVESFRKRLNNSKSGTPVTLYRPVVEFVYTVNGHDYRSKQIKLLTEVSGQQSYAEKVAAKYPAGSTVDVHYDPANPGNAALENPTGMAWIVLALALGMFALTAYTLGLFA